MATAAAPLAAIVVGTAKAAQQSQRKLDQQLIYGPEMARSIPRVTVDSLCGVRTVAGKILLVFGDKKEEDETFSVAFTLELSPDPMPPLASTQMPDTDLFVPPFIEQPGVVAQLVRDLRAELRAMDEDLFEEEIEKLEKAAGNQDDDPGLVAFRLDEPGETYLIARIGGKRDGIFLFDRTASPAVTVFLHADSKDKTVPWEPFQRLFQSMRRWQRGSSAQRKLQGVTPERTGGIEWKDFLTAMWDAYREARQLLSSSTDGASPVLPAYYLLGNIGARLSYSVPRVISKTPDTEPPLVRSDLVVNVRREGDAPVIELHLRAPEYALVDGQKQAALQLLLENLNGELDENSFFSVVSSSLRMQYETALRDPARAADALVLLSYQDQPPKNEFLFVWSGAFDSEERDFAFRFRFEDGKLVAPELARALEDAATDEVPYHEDAAGLHDFFHAAWIWTIMGRWFPV